MGFDRCDDHIVSAFRLGYAPAYLPWIVEGRLGPAHFQPLRFQFSETRKSGDLKGHEDDASGYEQGGRPASAINVLVKEDLGGDCICHEGQRCCSWPNQTYVVPGQSKQQA